MDMHKITEEQLDDAAVAAIGAPMAEPFAANGAVSALDMELRDVVARLAAASPHMTPPPDLRGRILQAAIAAQGNDFKMEDYRKATRDNGKFYQWGFRAAVLFLMAAAGFNIFTQKSLKEADARVAELQDRQQKQTVAMATFMSPKMEPITFTQDEKVVARAFLNTETGKVVLIVPQGMVPGGAGQPLQLTLPDPVTGKEVAYETMVITVPQEFMGAPSNRSIEAALRVQKLSPDTTGVQPMTAGFNK